MQPYSSLRALYFALNLLAFHWIRLKAVLISAPVTASDSVEIAVIQSVADGLALGLWLGLGLGECVEI